MHKSRPFCALLGLSYRYKEALAACEEALQCDPTIGYVHYQKGKVLDRLRRPQEAQQAFEGAKELGYNA
jgi:tetratricopeptide (TPR) repeat protein